MLELNEGVEEGVRSCIVHQTNLTDQTRQGSEESKEVEICGCGCIVEVPSAFDLGSDGGLQITVGHMKETPVLEVLADSSGRQRIKDLS